MPYKSSSFFLCNSVVYLHEREHLGRLSIAIQRSFWRKKVPDSTAPEYTRVLCEFRTLS
jgi:hypothetical protein